MPRSPVAIALALLTLVVAPAAAHAAKPANLTAPAITGAAREGQVLTRDVGTWAGSEPITYTQRWQRCDVAGVECVTLPATGATYTAVAADVGYRMRVVVTASNPEGVATATSDATAVVTGTPPANTVAPAVTGNPRAGQTLTAGRGTWTGTLPMDFSYEWRRCDDAGSDCAPIAGATGTSLRLTAADIGATIRVRVTATNAAGASSSPSAATAVIGPPDPPVNTVLPVVTGTAMDGQSLTATTGTWTGATTITYARRWQRCDALGVACIDTAVTTPSYPAGPLDVGGTLRVVVTATNPDATATATSAVTPVVEPSPPANTAVPTVTGQPRVGQVLSATTGSWKGTAPLTYARVWQRCDAVGDACTAIAGATDGSYVLTADDLGRTIRHAVTATNAAGTGSVAGKPTAVIGPAQPPVMTVAPVVSGTPTDGQTLSAGDGTWTGAATIAYTRAWQRCDATGAACAPIGVTAKTYKLTSADIGATLRVAVTATNPDGTATATTEATGVVAALPPANTVLPKVSGTARDGQTLTGTTGTWTGSTPLDLEPQWLRCDVAGNACAAIPGATDTTLTLGSADVGATVKLQVRAVNAGGERTVTSPATVVIAAAPPANTVAPVVSGTARDGGTVTASTGTWTGTAPIDVTLKWRRCTSSGASCVDVPGATGETYALTAADVGSTLRVQVTAVNVAGTVAATSAPSAVVVAAPPVNTAAPVIAGTPVDGTLLTASPGTWAGTPTIGLTYRWERCDALLDCRAVPGATAATYHLTSADVDTTVRVVITATNAGGSATAVAEAGPPVAPAPPMAVTSPAISGITRDGQRLTASIGTWQGTTPMTHAYQWRRCDPAGAGCVDIAGATGPTHDLTAADVGSALRVAVVADNAAGTAEAVSAFTQAIAPLIPSNTVPPTVTGVARDGAMLTVQPGDWGGTPPLQFAYRWQRCDAAGNKCADIDGAALQTYVLATADAGFRVRAVVSATNGGGTASATTALTGVVQTNPPVNLTPPSLTGEPVDGKLLTAVDGTWTGVVTIGFDHRWWRCDAAGLNCGVVDGATDPTYRLGPLDVGITIRVEVIARNAGGSTSAFSDPSPVGQPAPPLNTAPPEVRGRHGVGELLEAVRGTWVGSPTLAYVYEWERCAPGGGGCTALPGEDSDAYRLAPEDLGATVRVRITASNPAGSATAVSEPSPVVRDDPPVALTAPSITGTPVAENVPLQAADGRWAGATPMTAAHRWRRCDAFGVACTDIAGATGSNYTPVAADVGATLRVVVSMDNGVGLTSATSAATPIVAPAPPRSTVAPVVTASGTRPGKDLTSTTGQWAGAKPMSFAQQWLRCDLAGEACLPIADATAVKYTLTGADVGRIVRLRVTATNATGSVSAVSGPVGPITAVPPATAAKPKVTLDGKPKVGSVLRADAGNWTGTAPLFFSYRWQSCASNSDCRDLPGATGTEYEATAGDVGRRLRVVVQVTNAGGAASAESAVSDAVAGTAPVAVEPPSVQGTLRDGRTLTARPGTWSGSGVVEHDFAWLRCSGTRCRPISGATEATFRLGSEDVGERIAVRVTARNAFGRAAAESAPTDAVTAVGPAARRVPKVSRLPTVIQPGLMLRGRPGRWTGTAPLKLSYQWLVCNTRGRRCKLLKGAKAPNYELRPRDVRGTRLRWPLRLAVTATNAAGERTALSEPLGVRRTPPKLRVTVRSVRLAGRTLTVTVACAAGPVPCGGWLRAVGQRARVTVPAAGTTAVAFDLSRKQARKLGRRVRVRFRSDGRASGRSVSVRVRLRRPPAPSAAEAPASVPSG